MDPAIIIAVVALVGSIISTSPRRSGHHGLEHRRASGAVLQAYRQPLLGAAFERQSRLYNILRGGFTTKFLRSADAARSRAAVETTLSVLAQYFGWTEIIRREIQLLRFTRTEQTREVRRLIGDISEAFLTDGYGTQFMIWRVEQRGVGEMMIVRDGPRPTCMGYVSFLKSEAIGSLEPVRRDLLALDEEAGLASPRSSTAQFAS